MTRERIKPQFHSYGGELALSLSVSHTHPSKMKRIGARHATASFAKNFDKFRATKKAASPPEQDIPLQME